MVNILLIDDGSNKVEKISTILSENKIPFYLDHTSNILAARKSMQQTCFDIVIVDLNIKRDAVSPAEIEAGLQFLDLTFHDKKCKLPKEFFFLTEMEDQDTTLKFKVAEKYSKLWYYQPDYQEWNLYLKSRVKFYHEYNNRHHYDVVFITALEEEFNSLIANNEVIQWNRPERKNQMSRCVGRITIPNTEIRLSCIAISPFKKGMSATAALSSMAFESFKPRVAFLLGLCAGTDSEKLQFGDTLVSAFIWDYHSGKITNTGFIDAPFQIKASDDLYDVIVSEFLSDSHRYSNMLNQDFKDLELKHQWSIHFGPTVSGGSVIASESMVQAINAQHKDILGIDMEGYGFYEALQLYPDIQGCMIKSISDFGNSQKDDKYRKLSLHMTNKVLCDVITNSGFIEIFSDL